MLLVRVEASRSGCALAEVQRSCLHAPPISDDWDPIHWPRTECVANRETSRAYRHVPRLLVRAPGGARADWSRERARLAALAPGQFDPCGRSLRPGHGSRGATETTRTSVSERASRDASPAAAQPQRARCIPTTQAACRTAVRSRRASRSGVWFDSRGNDVGGSRGARSREPSATCQSGADRPTPMKRPIVSTTFDRPARSMLRCTIT